MLIWTKAVFLRFCEVNSSFLALDRTGPVGQTFSRPYSPNSEIYPQFVSAARVPFILHFYPSPHSNPSFYAPSLWLDQPRLGGPFQNLSFKGSSHQLIRNSPIFPGNICLYWLEKERREGEEGRRKRGRGKQESRTRRWVGESCRRACLTIPVVTADQWRAAGGQS